MSINIIYQYVIDVNYSNTKIKRKWGKNVKIDVGIFLKNGYSWNSWSLFSPKLFIHTNKYMHAYMYIQFLILHSIYYFLLAFQHISFIFHLLYTTYYHVKKNHFNVYLYFILILILKNLPIIVINLFKRPGIDWVVT